MNKNDRLQVHHKHLNDKQHIILEPRQRIRVLEQYLRLATLQPFSARSEKLAFQLDWFDAAETEVTLCELEAQLPEESCVRPQKKTRQRGFSDTLQGVQVHLSLTDEQKAGAARTCFTKVKEALAFIPAKVKVLEYWLFNHTGEDVMLAAPRTVHLPTA